MKFVTIATTQTAGFNRLKNSADHYNIDLVNLGVGKTYQGNGTKIVFLKDYLKTLLADEIVLYTDAYDSLFLASPDKIESAFRSFNHPFVMSAEQNFSMKSNSLFFYWINLFYWLKYPKKYPKPYRYINAGSFVGEAGYMLNLFNELPLDAATPSDQTIFHKYYTDHADAIRLDHTHLIFTCNGGRSGLEETDYTIRDNQLVHPRTGSTPCILHVPGKNRTGLEIIYGKLFPQFKRPLSADEVKQYRKKRLISLCLNTVSSEILLVKCGAASLIIVVGLLAIFIAFR